MIIKANLMRAICVDVETVIYGCFINSLFIFGGVV
jgi:hypothetical protein